jgi:hypothetical protein
MADFVVDTFTDTSGTALTSHTGEVGATWTVQTGGLQYFITDANRMRFGTSSFGQILASGVPPSPDYTLKCDLVVLSDIGQAVQIMVRAPAGVNDGYAFVWNGNHAGKWSLVRTNDFTDLATPVSSPVPTAGNTYALELSVVGTQLTAKIDGVTILSGSDSGITAAGFIGLGANGKASASNSNGFHIDNVRATPYVAFMPSPIPRLILSQGNV